MKGVSEEFQNLDKQAEIVREYTHTLGMRFQTLMLYLLRQTLYFRPSASDLMNRLLHLQFPDEF